MHMCWLKAHLWHIVLQKRPAAWCMQPFSATAPSPRWCSIPLASSSLPPAPVSSELEAI